MRPSPCESLSFETADIFTRIGLRPNEENDVTSFAFLQMVWRPIPTQDWISN